MALFEFSPYSNVFLRPSCSAGVHGILAFNEVSLITVPVFCPEAIVVATVLGCSKMCAIIQLAVLNCTVRHS